MHHLRKFGLLTVVLLLVWSGAAVAQSLTISGTQTIAAVNGATAGSQPNPVTTTAGSTTYSFQAKGASHALWRITGRLSTALPTGMSLAVQLFTQGGIGTSAGLVTLSTTDQSLVTGIPDGKNGTANNIQYRLTALVTAGVRPTTTCTNCVVFTLVTP
jgi:hypothetical protein